MKVATKYLYLNVLLGSCVLLAGGSLNAEDRTAGPVLRDSVNKLDADAVRPIAATRLASNAEIQTAPYEPLPSPGAHDRAAPEMLQHSFPHEHSFQEDPGVTIPPADGGFHHGHAAIIGNGVGIDDLATLRADSPYQHPAPEIVLRFSTGCTDAEFANWRLSSRDVPRSSPAIPHGPLMIELRFDVAPVDFVELMLDGKALQPTDYATASPLSYELPCPAVGPHILQARYLSGNIWSYYSTPLRFEVRLPRQPRIIAASDFDRDPTPLTRNGLTSITTGSIKVHLANVSRGDSIVAYIDGKPVSSQSDYEPCCRIIKVEGIVTPGVHKLAVRTVGCPGACSITSKPSNEIAFHYYDERVYLLRPGAGCESNCPK